MKIYLAGPLFTIGERKFNSDLSAAIRALDPDAEIVLPQEYASRIIHEPAFCSIMYTHAIRSIEECDVIVAVADGADADSGTCVEIGYAKAKGKSIVGVRTDLRPSEDDGLNLMVSRSCDRLIRCTNQSTDIDSLAYEIVHALKKLAII